ncbi:MAG: phosphoglycerate kinase [Crocinitomicaceae bacterium]|jgi:phosphoglycerate kinase|tara:strand:- start:26181 stop:27374 length:1194 start_codon:yes stop_codon:yes gene_type:complete
MTSFKTYNFKGKKAIVRVDFNVPLAKENFEITDDKRMQAALPTINKILSDGGSIILLSHLGRPKNGPDDSYSLSHLTEHLQKITNTKVLFADDCIGAKAEKMASNLSAGEILLLENVRFYAEETKGDDSFAEKLANLGDCFVNDAFGTAHRAHASTTQIAKFFPNNKMCGLLMEAEINSAKKVMEESIRPFTAIVGGAKVSDKVLIVENLMSKADHIIIGGGMAYTFKKALGGDIGKSLCENDRISTCRKILSNAEKMGVKIHLPQDSIVADSFSATAATRVSESDQIDSGWMGLDIGPKASEKFSRVIADSKTILWNGPMGVFEMPPFEEGTKTVANAVAEATKNGAYSLIGGGDSAAAAKKFNVDLQISHVSTGGGALLEFFEGKILPGIAAIER